ncbi:hypothetical protein [Sporosarcina limicola]|uniref:Lipoprotein n=1 Tax=Sporosarcina limicola TaxID=34101 RepID=A0A927MIY9_9BACL|nr:hypothetical protein [Sporosarcina limicola]MBE1553842.1 hypothetical protein [Sporosarcina limicola]
MKKLFSIVALSVCMLSACVTNDSQSNTISTVELSERENAFLTITSDKSFVFDFDIDDEYKVLSVWVEKYEFGKLVDDKISSIITPVEKSGSIIFATAKADHSRNQQTFNIGISSNDSTRSISSFDDNAAGVDKMSSVWSDFQEKNMPIEGEVVLASICYSSNESGMSSLRNDFYKDVDGHMSELEEYDVVYLLKAEFIGENGGDS